MHYDCVIIGGGPAGLNAALVLGRARRSVALLDNNKPRNAVTHASHGFITRDGVKPAEFRRIAHEEISQYPSVHYRESEVTDVRKTDSGFHVDMDQGERIEASKLIIATGLKETFPSIAGFYDFYGKSLFNCPYCDGWELRDQPLVYVSEGSHTFRVAKLIHNWSKHLIVCTNGASVPTEEEQAILHSNGIILDTRPIDSFMGQNGQLEAVKFIDGTFIERQGGFVAPEFSPKFLFAEKLGCETNEMGGFVTDIFGRTTVAGIYAAGDTIMPSQLIIAAAEGSKAAAGVNMDLTEEWFSRS